MKKRIFALILGATVLTGCASAPEKPDCNLNQTSCLLHWDDYVSHKRTEMNLCVNEACFEKGQAYRDAEQAFIYALYLQGMSSYGMQHTPR